MLKDNLSICAIFRDEASYLDEWLTFHSFVGVDRFYLYNDRSADNYLEVLKPWIQSGRVILLNASGNNQIDCYNHCLNNARFRTKWLAYIDIDEFLWSPTQKSLPELLADYVCFSGVTVRWVLFGSSGLRDKPTKGALESFTFCLPLDSDVSIEGELARLEKDVNGRAVTGNFFQGKSIINPRLVPSMLIHRPRVVVEPIVDEDKSPWDPAIVSLPDILPRWGKVRAEKFRINHYWTRSLVELEQKVSKREDFKGATKPDLKRFLARDSQLNVQEDLGIIEIWKAAKKARLNYVGSVQL